MMICSTADPRPLLVQQVDLTPDLRAWENNATAAGTNMPTDLDQKPVPGPAYDPDNRQAPSWASGTNLQPRQGIPLPDGTVLPAGRPVPPTLMEPVPATAPRGYSPYQPPSQHGYPSASLHPQFKGGPTRSHAEASGGYHQQKYIPGDVGGHSVIPPKGGAIPGPAPDGTMHQAVFPHRGGASGQMPRREDYPGYWPIPSKRDAIPGPMPEGVAREAALGRAPERNIPPDHMQPAGQLPRPHPHHYPYSPYQPHPPTIPGYNQGPNFHAPYTLYPTNLQPNAPNQVYACD